MWRLEAIDEMMAAFRAQRNLLPLDLPEQYVAHLRSLVRVRTADPFGNERVVYQAIGPDDFAHAETYDLSLISPASPTARSTIFPKG